MNPANRVEELFDGMSVTNPAYTSEETANLIAKAQVYAILALANAIDGLAHELGDRMVTTNAELGSIAIALGER